MRKTQYYCSFVEWNLNRPRIVSYVLDNYNDKITIRDQIS